MASLLSGTSLNWMISSSSDNIWTVTIAWTQKNNHYENTENTAALHKVPLPHRLGCNSLQPLLLTPCPAHRVQHQCTVKKQQRQLTWEGIAAWLLEDNRQRIYLNQLRQNKKLTIAWANWKAKAIGHFRVHLSLQFKARLSAKSLLWKSVFIHIEIGTNYHNKNFALSLALKDRLRGTRKWPIHKARGERMKTRMSKTLLILLLTSQLTTFEDNLPM